MIAALGVALWATLPADLGPLYRGLAMGKASGAWLFSIVQAVGEYAAQSASKAPS
jgi:hypothetical protein